MNLRKLLFAASMMRHNCFTYQILSFLGSNAIEIQCIYGPRFWTPFLNGLSTMMPNMIWGPSFGPRSAQNGTPNLTSKAKIAPRPQRRHASSHFFRNRFRLLFSNYFFDLLMNLSLFWKPFLNGFLQILSLNLQLQRNAKHKLLINTSPNGSESQ